MLNVFKIFSQLINRTDDQRKILSFYSKFMGRNDLCFDVGANIGNRTEVFLKLDAKVVCVEPQSSCFDRLSRLYRDNERVILVNKGLAEEEGHLTLHICEKAATISTMSDKWKNEGRFSNDYTSYIPAHS